MLDRKANRRNRTTKSSRSYDPKEYQLNRLRPVHTFSIVARDKKTGEMGVAVQSHWFSVGADVSWAEASVGAVATQSFVDPSYGPKGLELMRLGKSASETLKQLIAADSGEAVRQVAMVDSKGEAAVHTGKRCVDYAGHRTGDGYSVQANLMLNDKVPNAMANAFETAPGDLAERMMMALEAAQEVGGDIRGKQSAAMIMVKAQSSGKSWADCTVNLRVEDHPEPLKELRRLISVARAYGHMNAGDSAMEKNYVETALKEYGEAMKLAGDNVEIAFWIALTLALKGKVDQALPIFKKVFLEDRNWVEVLKRLPKAGMIPDDDTGRALVQRILNEARDR
ncbi:MAG TPA: DUF1028 domain-containing protein [Patescibacteria group bacterium]|nr:DUF1028 domain-containing protein [Patescibacteria group bacterium]